MPVEPGLTATASLVVTDADTAISWGSGDVPVLATPRVVALCERATMQATQGHLEDGYTSVGTAVQISHVAPAPVDREVRAHATLDRVEGQRLQFSVSVSDDHGLIAAGKVTRAVVSRERFLAKLGNSN